MKVNKLPMSSLYSEILSGLRGDYRINVDNKLLKIEWGCYSGDLTFGDEIRLLDNTTGKTIGVRKNYIAYTNGQEDNTSYYSGFSYTTKGADRVHQNVTPEEIYSLFCLLHSLKKEGKLIRN